METVKQLAISLSGIGDKANNYGRRKMNNKDGQTYYDWFFCTKPLPLEKVKIK